MPLAVKDLMKLSTEQMSMVVSIYFLGIVITRPFSGVIADKIGKKTVSFIAFIFFSLCTAIYLGLDSLYFIILIRFLHGIIHSVGTTAHAAMAVDFSPAHMKGQAIGYYGLAMCLAMVIAPALGLYILDHYDYHTLLIIATAFGFVGSLITGLIKAPQKKVTTEKKTFSFKNLIEKKALPIGFLSLMLSLCYSGVISFIAVYLKERNIDNGSIYFYLALAAAMIVSRPTIGKIIDKKGASFLVPVALLMFSVSMVLMGFANSLPFVILTGIVLGLSYGCVFPCFQTIAVECCPPERSGSAMGTFFLFYDLGFGIGAIVLAKVSNLSGYSNMYFIVSALILVILASFILLKSRINKQITTTTAESI